MKKPDSDMVAVTGVVEALRYASDDDEFQVLVVAVDDGSRCTAVVRGAALRVDEQVRLFGQWKRHRSGELQLEAARVERVLPTTPEGIVRFLSSSLVPGVGETYARKIVAHFGDRTLKVLSDEPARLREVPGIGRKRSEQIAAEWARLEAVRGVLIFLQTFGISPAYASRILKRYGDRAVAVIRDDPWQLARDIRGIGFVLADRIARTFEMDEADPRRLRAALEYALHEARGEGHTFLPREELVVHTVELLRGGVADAQVEEALLQLVHEQRLALDLDVLPGRDAVYRRFTLDQEEELSARVEALARASCRLVPPGPLDWEHMEAGFTFSLSDEQRRALEVVCGASVAVLTGGPGTGKTTIVRAVVRHAQRQRCRILLAAPTGRAARRLAESTGLEARTIHRLLEYDPHLHAFTRDEVTPLDCDLVVIDESSMLDQELGAALFRALAPGTAVVLVGDADQLPPVGAGQVFADLIASAALPVANLNRVFRQGERSDIVVAAHAVRAGVMPELPEGRQADFFFIRRPDPDEALATLVELVTERMPRAFGLDPLRDIQVLVPVHRGPLGTKAVNEVLQRHLGGHGEGLTVRGTSFHAGDRVMQVRNNYELDCFNGDIGFVLRVDRQAGRMVVGFDDREVVYSREAAEELEHAWAITIHKSQGSEFPAVVMALATQHFKMLQRNLVYTGMTRARSRLVVVGNDRAFRMAVDHVSGVERFTGLAVRVRRRFGPPVSAGDGARARGQAVGQG